MSAAAASPIPIQSERGGNRDPHAGQAMLKLAGKVTADTELFILLFILTETVWKSRKPGTAAPDYSRPLTLAMIAARAKCTREFASRSLTRMEKAGLIRSLTPKEARKKGYDADPDANAQAKRYRCLVDQWEAAPVYEPPKPEPEPDLPPAAAEPHEIRAGEKLPPVPIPSGAAKFTVECAKDTTARISYGFNKNKVLAIRIEGIRVDMQINGGTKVPSVSDGVPVLISRSTVENPVTPELTPELSGFLTPIFTHLFSTQPDAKYLQSIAQELGACPVLPTEEGSPSFSHRLTTRIAAYQKQRKQPPMGMVKGCAEDARKAWEAWEPANRERIQAEQRKAQEWRIRDLADNFQTLSQLESQAPDTPFAANETVGEAAAELRQYVQGIERTEPELYRKALALVEVRR